jgi:diguanylate cyclase (GGDEF)-like protein/PAS domain S-box-containing protein
MLDNNNLRVRAAVILRIALLFALSSVFVSTESAHATEYRSRAEYQKPDGSRNVLVLNSSHRGYGWTDSIMAGVEAVMRAAPEDIELWVEYLDANRLQSTSFARQLKLLYQSKFENVKFDVIITSDRKALEFLLDNRKEIADGVPVVFSTAGDLGSRIADGQSDLTGVSESGDFVSTLDTAFKLHSDIEHMVFISPGLRSRHLIESMVADYRPELELSIWDYESLTEIERALSLLSKNAVLVPVGEPVTVGGVAMPMNKFVSWIVERTDAPIYTVWDFALGHGIVGGKLVSGFTQGEMIAQAALDILRGQQMPETSVAGSSPSRFMFDYEQLQRFDVDMGLLPPNSVVVNRPTTLYTEHKQAVWSALGIISSLFMVILFLGINVRRRKRAEGSLRTNQERFRDFAESAADWFWEADADTRFTYISGRAQDVLGVPVDDLCGLTIDEVFSDLEQNADELTKQIAKVSEEASFQIQSFWRRPDGVRRVIITSGKPVRSVGGQLLGFRGTSRDISDSFSLTEELGYQASHDTLTNLLNRRAFEQRLQTLLSRIKETPGEHALCYLDLDQFKVVNDTCGHVAGDELLRRLAQKLQNQVRKRDTVARLGGDEFGVLLEDCPPERAWQLASNLHKCINDFQFDWNDQSFHVGASIGLVPINSSETTLDELLAAADRACYVAKEQGRNRVHLYRSDDVAVANTYGEIRWVSRIQRALDEDRVVICLQPIRPVIPLAGVGESYEVLVRLIDEKGALVSPSAFLPAAERYNLATALDRRVLDEGMRYFTADSDRLERLSTAFVNLSAHTFGKRTYLDYVLERARFYNMPPEKLCFEISERTAISRLEDAKDFVEELRQIGCRFALDDFGRGTYSFRYLKELQVDFVKIDGSFVRNMLNDPMDLVVVRSINEIARLSNAATVAEYVESPEILDKLAELGIDYAQGFAVGRPMPIAREAA